ncbi:NAD-dependent deacetylase sirtuin-6 [Platysternon megacephalum]|uniref:Pleckstrin homology domain-containing family J member 1 n=1 Tax=Platysternon megacephalum TaxID=55544 RepID=A0A4D9E4V4_9SAUR|nr:NAD-dependent deacetylase sirtuin-6 [Platysternon megacephalum]
MRYSERELLSLSRQPAEKAAEILMRVPKKGSVLKKRLVKLVVNFLFYFRTDEAEPIGALLLEHCKITKEEENVFSISFIEEPERKYSFECDTEEQCQEWIEALRRASYEFMRRSLIFYRNEIQKMTGKVSVSDLSSTSPFPSMKARNCQFVGSGGGFAAWFIPEENWSSQNCGRLFFSPLGLLFFPMGCNPLIT